MYIVSTTIRRTKPRHLATASTRVNLRMHPETKALLVQASKIRQVKLTEFMINSAQAAAEMTLADRTQFALSDENWARFNAALDAAPRDIPALRKLLREKSVFDTE